MATATDTARPTGRSAGAPPERLDAVVVGGGQAGLATGYHLARAGLRFAILDGHERVGDAWRNRWDSLTLFTPAKLCGLPGMPFPGPPHHFPGKDEVADYLAAYARAMELPVRTGVEVRRVARHGDRWAIDSSGGTWIADAVVIATGGYQTPRIPAWAADLDPAIVQLHSSAYRNPGQLAPGPALVVGASHSGAEIAVEVARDHATTLVGRDTGQVPAPTAAPLVRLTTPLIWLVLNRVVTVATPVGRRARRHVRAHGFPLEHPNRSDLRAAGIERITERATGAQDGKPVLADGRVLDVHNVIWCTGFHGDYAWVEGVTYGDDGYPEQDRGVVQSARGLYFVGLKFQRTAASALIGGVGRDAELVARHIATSVLSGA